MVGLRHPHVPTRLGRMQRLQECCGDGQLTRINVDLSQRGGISDREPYSWGFLSERRYQRGRVGDENDQVVAFYLTEGNLSVFGSL
jgi:hypothetical protein